MRTGGLLAALLLCLYAGLGVHAAWIATPTVDEFAHLPSGCSALRDGNFRLYANNPPLARMAMALPVVLAGALVPPPMEPGLSGWEPWVYGGEFLRLNPDRYLGFFFLGRLAVLATSLLGGVLLYLWSLRRSGGAAALGALFLYVACPNLQAHCHLATVDAACATTLLAAFFSLDLWRLRPAAWRLLLAGGLYGIALLTKFTALLAAPVLLSLICWSSLDPSAGAHRLLRALGRGLTRILIFSAAALLVLNLGYGLQGVLRPVGSFHWTSERCRGLAERLPPSLRLPLPRDFLAGFDEQALDTERGEFRCYFAGRWHSQSPAGFYLAVLALKLPVPTLLLLLATGAAVLRGPRGSALEEAFCWLWPCTLLAALSLFNALSGGIRYLLPALPFLFLGVSRLFAGLRPSDLRTPRGLALAAAGLALVANTVVTHPRQLGYFNSLGGGPDGGHRWLIDSNLDWGQDLGLVRPYMQRHGLDSVGLLYFGHVEPEIYGIRYFFPPPEPRSGTYVVSVNFALGYQYVAPDHGRMVLCREGAPAWLRSRMPDERIGSSLWVYRVP